MKKINFFGLFLFLIPLAVLFFNSCRKKESNSFIFGKLSHADMAVVPDGKDPSFVEAQLKWIARVLPGIAANTPNFKSDFHNILSNAYLLKKQNFASQISLLTTPINFTNKVNTEVDVLFPSNNYDSAYFFSFLYEDCINRTLVRINKETVVN